ARYRKALTGFDADATTTLLPHRWPGNVRERGHTVERALLMAEPAVSSIAARRLGLHASRGSEAHPEAQSLEDAERVFIEKVLARHGGDVRLAAPTRATSPAGLFWTA